MNMLQLLQQQKIVSIREFIHKLSQITSAPKSKIYTVVKNGKKVGVFIPEQYENEVLGMTHVEVAAPKKYSSLLAEYDRIAFRGKKTTSQDIDRILYGENGK